jgi:hypothetical protein
MLTTLRPAVAASLALRSVIVAAFVYAAAAPSLPQLQDPATRARMLAWPIGALAVPIVLRALRGRRPYPWAVDAALALPFALDSAGNVLDLYNRCSGSALAAALVLGLAHGTARRAIPVLAGRVE